MATAIKEEEYLEVPPGFTPNAHPQSDISSNGGGSDVLLDPNSVHSEISINACNHHKCLSSANCTSRDHRIEISNVFSSRVKQRFPVPRKPRPVVKQRSVSQLYKREVHTRSRCKVSLPEQTRYNTRSGKLSKKLSSVQTNNRASMVEMTCNVGPNILEDTKHAMNYKDFNPTIAAIKAKYGHIDKDCDLNSEWLRKLMSFGLCNVLKELNAKKIDELDMDSLDPYYKVVQDIRKMKMDVNWLVERLDEIKDAITARDKVKSLVEERTERVKKMEGRMKELRRHKIEVEKLDGLVALEKLMIDELDEEMKIRASKYENFRHGPLMDGLI